METTEHPGANSLASIAAGTGSLYDCYRAIDYLAERVLLLEEKLAERSKAFKPPTPEEVTAYAASIQFTLDGQAFCDYYAARNWCVGKVKMKDWKACVRTWKQRRATEVPRRGSTEGSNYAQRF